LVSAAVSAKVDQTSSNLTSHLATPTLCINSLCIIIILDLND
jgi:hypothetical protein